ncbi:MAG: SocA family protein [Mediterranea sp.]|jgi:uncharacterized phage-associated protein|nr:SocA family protein [Mediterranea sp.]
MKNMPILNEKTYFCAETSKWKIRLKIGFKYYLDHQGELAEEHIGGITKVAKMTNDDVLTLKASVLYVLNKAGGALDKYRIYKSLYFANKEHLNKYGRLIVSDTFFALPNGPVPTKLANVFDSMRGGDISRKDRVLFSPILESVEHCGYDADNFFRAKERPDMDELSQSDIECLEFGLNKCKGKSFGEIKEESHDSAWEKASQKPRLKSIDILDMIDDENVRMKEYVIDNMYCF